MSSDAQSISRHELEARIVKHCWEDSAFQKEFVSDPAGCFAKYLNTPAEKLPKIIVHDEQPGTWHIVLPAKPATAGELSDEDLEKIAGGTDFVFGTAIALMGVSYAVGGAALSAAAASGIGTGKW